MTCGWVRRLPMVVGRQGVVVVGRARSGAVCGRYSSESCSCCSTSLRARPRPRDTRCRARHPHTHAPLTSPRSRPVSAPRQQLHIVHRLRTEPLGDRGQPWANPADVAIKQTPGTSTHVEAEYFAGSVSIGLNWFSACQYRLNRLSAIKL